MRRLSWLFTLLLFTGIQATAQSFTLTKDILAGTGSSYPSHLTDVNGTLFFTAQNETTGWDLWRSNGTEAGTQLITNLFPSSNDGSPAELISYNGAVYFAAMDENGVELWKSDGSAAGTVMIRDINPGPASSTPLSFHVSDNVLYFTAQDELHGLELWKTNGTTAGTVLVHDINPGPASSFPYDLTNNHGTLGFFATTETTGWEFYKTDGTPAGTTLIKDIHPGPQTSYPESLVAMGGNFYFTASDPIYGWEIWKSDGTEAGTTMLRDIRQGFDGSAPSWLTPANGKVFFTAFSSAGNELWKTDGTEAGTVRVADINPGGENAYPQHLTYVNGRVLFAARNEVHGEELWASDGTEAGTAMVRDIALGADGSYPSDFRSIVGLLYFRASDGISGLELWKSDGTAAGTELVQDIFPGGDAYPDGAVRSGYTIYVSAEGPGTGKELWSASLKKESLIRIIKFNGKLHDNVAELTWNINDETNIESYAVERSADGVSFNAIGIVPPGLNVWLPKDHRFDDKEVFGAARSVSYYRLRIMDFGGSISYSDTISLQQEKEKVRAALYPNPLRDAGTLRITTGVATQSSIAIYDKSGRLVKHTALTLNEGVTFHQLATGNLGAGAYLLVLRTGATQLTVPFIKQ